MAALEIELRTQPEGGEVLMPAELRGAGAGLPRERCVLLVHGYNNTEGQAAAAYLGFRGRQYEQFPALAPEALEARLADAFWPGDAKWWGPFDLLDFLFYPAAVGVARDEAPAALAEAIGRIPFLVELEVVAHSLGCRLALETLDLLRRAGGPSIGRVCLMAAAVPCEFVEAGGRFEPLLLSLQASFTEVRVLHSTSDLVLGLAFLAGQPAAGEPSEAALGYRGPPPGMPGFGANVSDFRVPHAGHGDYWGQGPDRTAAFDARRFLALDDVREVGAPRTV